MARVRFPLPTPKVQPFKKKMQYTSVVRLKKLENLYFLKKTFKKPLVFIFFTNVGNKKPKSSTLPKPYSYLKLIKRTHILKVFKKSSVIDQFFGAGALYLYPMHVFPSKLCTLSLLNPTDGLVFQNALAARTFYDIRRLYLTSSGGRELLTSSLPYLFSKVNPYLTTNYIVACTLLLRNLINSPNSI